MQKIPAPLLSYAPPPPRAHVMKEEEGEMLSAADGVVVRIPSLVHIQSAFIRHTSPLHPSACCIISDPCVGGFVGHPSEITANSEPSFLFYVKLYLGCLKKGDASHRSF